MTHRSQQSITTAKPSAAGAQPAFRVDNPRCKADWLDVKELVQFALRYHDPSDNQHELLCCPCDDIVSPADSC